MREDNRRAGFDERVARLRPSCVDTAKQQTQHSRFAHVLLHRVVAHEAVASQNLHSVGAYKARRFHSLGEGLSTFHLLLGISAAYALSGDGRAAISAARKVEIADPDDRGYRIMSLLLTAAGHAIEGNRDEADAFLERAHRQRDDLCVPRKLCMR